MYEAMNNISRIFRRYRFYYKLTDFILLFLILYTLSYYCNVISLFSQYMEYYVVDAVSLDEIIIIGLSGLVSGLLVFLLYMRKAPLNPIEMIESRYEWMRERLPTAWENRDENNVVVTDLVAQVSSHLNQVDVGSFLDKRHLITRLLFSVVLVVSVVSLTTTQTHLDVTPENISQIVEKLGGQLPERSVPATQSNKKNGGDKDIYGETSVAAIEGENVELTIIPGLGTSVTIRHTSLEDDVQFIPSQTYPVDILPSAAADEKYSAIAQMSSQDRNLISDYAVLRSKLHED